MATLATLGLDTWGEGLGAMGAWELVVIRVVALFNPATAGDDISDISTKFHKNGTIWEKPQLRG
jgi:hypothetical protein